MNGWQEKKLVRRWRKRHIKTWQLLLLFLLCLTVSVFFLRQNNLKMVVLRNKVIAADERGSGVAVALKDLNEHVFSHMNTQIVRPIELVHTYNRQAKAAIRAASEANSGRDIYAEATQVCEQRGVPLTSIAQCAADYATTNSSAVGSKEINLPDKNRFIYTFATPLWTPDAAGISLLITGVLLVWLLLRGTEYILVRLVVRRRLKNNF